MRKGARYNLEFALMADGVKAADVYKVLGTKDGADRAFKKLGELKPHIQWWEAGALPPQFLVAGDVAMTTAFSGRIDAAQREGQNLKITWTGGIYDLDFWVMPKGGANKEAAMKFIALASSPDAQAEYARHISYGPTHTKAMAKIDPKVQALLPTSPANSKVTGKRWGRPNCSTKRCRRHISVRLPNSKHRPLCSSSGLGKQWT